MLNIIIRHPTYVRYAFHEKNDNVGNLNFCIYVRYVIKQVNILHRWLYSRKLLRKMQIQQVPNPRRLITGAITKLRLSKCRWNKRKNKIEKYGRT